MMIDFNEEEYYKKKKENNEKNEKYLNEFEVWLKEQKLNAKTIKKHLKNVEFYLNTYLQYYDSYSMEEGIEELNEFMLDFFVRKCLWSTGSAIKENATSFKKFYKCMQELGHITDEQYHELELEIKSELDNWVENCEKYNSGDFSSFIPF